MLPQLGDYVVHVVGLVLLDVDASGSWPGLWIVVEGVVVTAAHLEEGVGGVDIFAEIIVIDFVNISFVHVGLQEDVEDVFRRADAELAECPEELVLGHMLVRGDVKVLEHGLQMDPLDPDGLPVLGEDAFDHLLLLRGEMQVLAAGWHGVVDSDWGNCRHWIFLDTVGGESRVDAGAEVLVVDHVLWIMRSLVLGRQGSEFFSRQVEVEHGEDLLELILRHLASSKLVEIEEELLYSHPLHYDGCLQAFLNVFWVIGRVHSLLQESIVDHIQAFGRRVKEGGTSVSQLSDSVHGLGLGILCNVLWEHVLWSVNVSAEFEIVHLSDIALIKVLSKQQLIQPFSWRDELELLEHASELLGSDMAALRSIVVLELWLDEDALVYNFKSNRSKEGNQFIFLAISEVGRAL